MTRSARVFVLSTILAAGLGMCLLTGLHAFRTNGSSGFPLDDPWIHLQFAKNLHDYGSFSYFKNEMPTSGSTSPLYTALLALGLSITSNEIALSYILGVTFFLLAAFYLFLLALNRFDNSLLFAAALALLFLFEPRLQWIALSGMETTLFIFLICATMYYYLQKRPVLVGIGGGLLIWARPEALLFLSIMIMDTLYQRYFNPSPLKIKSEKSQPTDVRWLRKSIGISALFMIAYAGFNLLLSGSLFPNTMAAKTKYYATGGQDFFLQVFHFLTDHHLIAITPFAAVSILSSLISVVKRKPVPMLIPLFWCVAMVLAYWRSLPFLYQEGRYLMPILPFYIILGLDGVRITFLTARNRIHRLKAERTYSLVTSLILALFVAVFAVAGWEGRTNYAEFCRYITERQVRTAHWLHDHLPANAIIATHDIGAIGFYSGRKVVDMVGLVSPEMIERIGSLDKLQEFLRQQKATHLVVLRNWFEISNQNPVYQTDEQHPEIMEVFEYQPRRTHFVTKSLSTMLNAARYYLSVGSVQQAGPILEQAVRMDPQCSKAHFLLGAAYSSSGNLDQADVEIGRAIALHPELWDAYTVRAEIAARRNKPSEAIKTLEDVLVRNPSYANGYRALAQVYQEFHIDTTKANSYLERYGRLTQGSVQ